MPATSSNPELPLVSRAISQQTMWYNAVYPGGLRWKNPQSARWIEEQKGWLICDVFVTNAGVFRSKGDVIFVSPQYDQVIAWETGVDSARHTLKEKMWIPS